MSKPCQFLTLLLVVSLALTACSVPTDEPRTTNVIHDPYESFNRSIHSVNVSFDRWILRPTSRGYTTVLPDEFETLISNFATTASMPSAILNGVLQFDLKTTTDATARLLVNATLGLLGFFDVATALQIDDVDTDFGETLYAWGVSEGAYIELPLLGPATERSATGRIIDIATNPLRFLLQPPHVNYPRVASVGKLLTQRNQLSDVIDTILDESADSYTQLRLTYLQSRRFELGDIDNTVEEDPYEIDTEGF